MKCDECGKESRTGALEALFERCDVCGKSLCLLCQGVLADNHGATHLCPPHYKQAREFIEGMKPKEWDITIGFSGRGERRDHQYCARIGQGSEEQIRFIDGDVADALYSFMEKEREG